MDKETLERYKKYLTNAQIKELAAKAERYKLLNAQRRAEAQNSILSQQRQARRGLQNVGLASREGKVISGMETARNDALTNAYAAYNRQLRKVEDAQTQNAAARMASANIAAQRRAAEQAAQQQAEEQAQIQQQTAAQQTAAQQAAALKRAGIGNLLNKEVSDSGSGFQTAADEQSFYAYDPRKHTDAENIRYYQRVAQMNGLRGSEANTYALDKAREAGIANAQRREEGRALLINPNKARREQMQGEIGKVEDYVNSYAHQFSVDYGVSMAALKRTDPTSAAQIEERVDYLYSYIDKYTSKWDRMIAQGGKEAETAKREKAKIDGSFALLAESTRVPAEYRNLYYMSDDEFEVAFGAEEKLYEDQLAEGRVIEGDFNARREAFEAGREVNGQDIQRDATIRHMWYEKVKADRAAAQPANMLAQSVTISDRYKDKYPSDGSRIPTIEYVYSNQKQLNWHPVNWANPADYKGSNWRAARDHGWSADDYAKKHDTNGSKYAALVNEWSYIGGRQANLYAQDKQTENIVLNAGEFIGSIFGGKINRNAAYEWFRNECVMTFNGEYETSGTSEQKEQMDAMLTLANLMTDEERARFNTLKNTIGGKDADEYFEYLYNSVLPQRFRQYITEYMGEEARDGGFFGRSVLSLGSVGTNIVQGVTRPLQTMTSKQTDPVAAQLTAAKYNTAQNMRGAIGNEVGNIVTEKTSNLGKGFSEWLGGAANFMYGTNMSMIDSGTVALISSGLGNVFSGALKGFGVGAEMAAKIGGKAGSVLGGAILGGSAYNSAYDEALQRGLSPEKARMTAFGNGVNEMLFESLSLDLLVSRFKTGDMLKVSKNGFVNWFVNTLVQGGVEGSEEIFTDMANNLWDKSVNKIYAEELTKLREYISQGMSYEDAKKRVSEEYADQLWQSFLGGAISGGVMGGLAGARYNYTMREYERTGKTLDSKMRSTIDGYKFKDEQLQEIQKQSKKTNQDYGVLFNGMLSELAEKYEGNVQQAVKDGLITNEDAALLEKWQKNGTQILDKDGKVVENEQGVTADELQTVNETLSVLNIEPLMKIAQAQKQLQFNKDVGVKNAELMNEHQARVEEARQTLQDTVAEINADESLTAEQKKAKIKEARQTYQAAESKSADVLSKATGNKLQVTTKDGVNYVKTAKGSGTVTFDFSTRTDGQNTNHTTLDEMTEYEKSALRLAAMVAQSRNVNVKVESQFVGKDENGKDRAKQNGYYDRKTNTIHINLSGENSVLWTLSHELTHYLAAQNTQAFRDLSDAIKTKLQDAKLDATNLDLDDYLEAADFQQYLQDKDNLWDALMAYEQDRGYSADEAEEEIIARCCERFLSDDVFIRSFAQQHLKSAKAVAAFLTRMSADMEQAVSEASSRASERGVYYDMSPEQQLLAQVADISEIAKKWVRAVNSVEQKQAKADKKVVTKASTQESVKRSDAEYLDLARRYESGDKSVEAELRKAVDAAAKAAGYPIHAYRGGGNVHNVFDTNRGAGTTQYGRGTYFTDAKGLAKEWAAERAGEPDKGYVGEYYVGIKKMFDDTSTIEPTQEWKNVERILKGYGVDSARIKHAQNYGFEGIAKALQSVGIISKGAFDAYSWKNAEKVNKILREAGYDGIKGEFYDSYQYVIFNPAQAKSADLVTYDDSGNIIPLSERFKTDRTGEEAWKNEDIRYSKAESVKLSAVDSPVVNKIADATFPIQPTVTERDVKYESKTDPAIKKPLLDIQDSMFHPVIRSIQDAVPIKDRTLAYAVLNKAAIPFDISQYEKVEDGIVELAKYLNDTFVGKYDSQGNLILPEETVKSNNIFANASYQLDAEPTTECFRQSIYRAFLKVVTDKLGRPVTQKEAIIVNQACVEIGLDAPCIYCYSLLDRKAKEAYKLQYLAERDAFFARLDEIYKGDMERFRKDRAAGKKTTETKKGKKGEADVAYDVWDKPYQLYLSRVTDPAAYKNGKYQKSAARKGNWSKAYRVNLWLDVYEQSRGNGTMVTAKDVRNVETDAESLVKAQGNELRTRELNDLIGWAQASSQAKIIVPYSSYTNEGMGSILSWSEDKIKMLNSEYGLRWYSHADFHPAFIVDNMQQIMDASVKGLKGLMYLKPTEAAEIYAPTGMLINLSCFAQYKNGQYVVDDRMGADWETVQRLRNKYDNVGAVMVVTSDDMWMWAMTQDWVDVIIPLHLVRSGQDFVDTFGLQNYSAEQADTLKGASNKAKFDAFIAAMAKEQQIALDDKKSIDELKKANKSVYPSEHQNDYAKYMEACRKRGLTPRFDRMRRLIEQGGMSWGGKSITLDDYMKCVNETRMPYTKAQPLKPDFDFDAARRAADTLKEKGFYQYFKPSVEIDGKTYDSTALADRVVEDIKEGKDPSKLGYGRDLAIDKSGKYIDIKSSKQARQRGVGGAHDTIASTMDSVHTDKLGGKEYLKYLHLGAKVVNQTATEAEIAEFKQRMNQLSQDNREAFLDKLREKLIRADEAAKVREVRDRQLARLKEEFRESREKARERKARSDITDMMKRNRDRLTKMLTNPTENSYVPVRLATEVSEYLARMNDMLTTRVPKTGQNAGQEVQTLGGQRIGQRILDAIERSYATQENIDAMRAEDPSFDPRGMLPVDAEGKPIADENLVKMIKATDEIIEGKHLDDLTTDELRYIANTMRGIMHLVTEANKVTVRGEKMDTIHAANQMDEELENSRVFGKKKNAITKMLNRYTIEALGLRRIAKIYSNSDENAVFVKLVDDLNEGALEIERIKQTLNAMFNDVTKRYEKDMKTWYGKNAEWIDIGHGVKITKGMRVSLAMHLLNRQNLRNVEEGGLTIPDADLYKKGKYKEAYKNGTIIRLTEAEAKAIVSQMTEAEKAYFEVAKEFFHKRAGYYINRTSLKLLGYMKAIVRNYFPIQTDDAYRTVQYDNIKQNASVEHPGFLESRKGTASVMYLNDITAVVNRQINGVAKYAGLAIPMRNYNNVMNQRIYEDIDGEWRSNKGTVHNVLEKTMGFTNKADENGSQVSMSQYVDQFIQDLTNPNIMNVNDKHVIGAQLANFLTSNYVTAVLTLNARVALSQVASLPTAAAEIPWKYIGQSFLGNVEGHLNRNASNELIDTYTPIFAMRRAGTQTEVSEIMKRKGLADKAEQKVPWALGWITFMDTLATRRLWYACERWVKGETNIPVGSDAFYTEVAKRYERVIQNTQPNFTVLQRSSVLRSKNPGARIFAMFGTQLMQNEGILIEKAFEFAQAEKGAQKKAALKGFGRAVSAVLTSSIVIGLEHALVNALRGRTKPMQDDEEKKVTFDSVRKYIDGEIRSSIFGSFLYVGAIYDVVNSVIEGWSDGDYGYDDSYTLPVTEALSAIVKFFKKQQWQYFGDIGNPELSDHQKWLKTKTFVNNLLTTVSYLTGLPLANASKTILNGVVPAVQDHIDMFKTGEFPQWWLHQSGRLDSDNSHANYTEWTNDGKKGSVYLYWENVAKNLPKEADTGYPKSEQLASKLLVSADLTPDEKAMLYRMLGGSDLENDGAVVYHPLTVNQRLKDDDREHGTVAVDFTNIDRYKMSQMGDAKYNGFLKAVEMGVPEDVAATAYRNYASAKRYETRRGVKADDSFHDWLFKMVSDPAHRAILDMQVVGSAKSVNGSIGYKANGDVYADYSSRESFDAYTKGKKDEKAEAVGNLEGTPQQKAEAFASMYGYTAKNGIVYNDKGVVQADYTSDEAYKASQMGESHYEKYTTAVKQGMSKENALKAVEKHKEIMSDDDKDNSTQATKWIFSTYKNANDRAIAGSMFTTKDVTIKDGRTYDENGYIYRDYTSVAWYKLSNRTLSKDGKNKRYETAQTLTKQGYTAEQVVETYVELDKLSKKSEWQKYLKEHGFDNEQIHLFLWSRGWAK